VFVWQVRITLVPLAVAVSTSWCDISPVTNTSQSSPSSTPAPAPACTATDRTLVAVCACWREEGLVGPGRAGSATASCTLVGYGVLLIDCTYGQLHVSRVWCAINRLYLRPAARARGGGVPSPRECSM
jgi:hypothetical protein